MITLCGSYLLTLIEPTSVIAGKRMRKRDVATDLTVVLAMVHDPRRGFDSCIDQCNDDELRVGN